MYVYISVTNSVIRRKYNLLYLLLFVIMLLLQTLLITFIKHTRI